MTEEITINGVNVTECEFCKPNPLYKIEYSCHCRGYIQDDGLHAHLSCVHNPNCYYKQLKRLEQENKELKEELKPYKHPDVVTLLTNWRTGELDRIHNKIANERDVYRSALDTIQRMVLSAWEQGKYLDGGLYNDLINEFTKINEVTDESN